MNKEGASMPTEVAMLPPEVDPGTNVAVAEKRGFIRRAGAAVAAGVVLVGGVASITSCSNENEPSGEGQEVVEPTAGNIELNNICEDGMFNNGPFAANADAEPGDLHIRPDQILETKEELVDFGFDSENGVVCNSAVTEAVLTVVYENMIGEGAAKARGFNTLADIDKQTAFYANPDNEDVAQRDARELARVQATYAKKNDKKIEGAYYKVVAEPQAKGSEESAVYSAVLEEVDLSIEKGAVWVLEVVTDSAQNDTGKMQQLIIDLKTGQFYLLNVVGKIPVKEPEQEQTTTTTSEQPQEQGAEQGQQDQEQGQGGGTFGETNNRGESNQPGHVPESGGAGGVTPGTIPSFGPGQGGQGGGGNGGGEHGPAPTQPKPTQPKPTQPKPTQPKPTQPPRTTTTQPPRTTTTRPKGEEPTTTLPGGWN